MSCMLVRTVACVGQAQNPPVRKGIRTRGAGSGYMTVLIPTGSVPSCRSRRFARLPRTGHGKCGAAPRKYRGPVPPASAGRPTMRADLGLLRAAARLVIVFLVWTTRPGRRTTASCRTPPGPVPRPQLRSVGRGTRTAPFSNCPSSTDLPDRTLRFLTGQRAARRQEIGTRCRRLPARRQALLAPAHVPCGDAYARLAAGFGIGIATVHRCSGKHRRHGRARVGSTSWTTPGIATVMRLAVGQPAPRAAGVSALARALQGTGA